MPSLSVIVVSHNEGRHLRWTVDNLLATVPSCSEIIVVDDVSTDGSAEFARRYHGVKLIKSRRRLGVSRARQHGGRLALGDVLVFCDAHIEVESRWAPPLFEALTDGDVGVVGPCVGDLNDPRRKGYGMTCSEMLLPRWLPRLGAERYPVPVLCGMFLAMRRDVFEDTGGFDPGMLQWGSEDVELSVRLWTAGYQCVVVPSVEILHLFRERHPYHVDAEVIEYNRLRAGVVHLTGLRLARFKRKFESAPGFAAVQAVLDASDSAERRQRIVDRRRFDDDWYFQELCTRFPSS